MSRRKILSIGGAVGAAVGTGLLGVGTQATAAAATQSKARDGAPLVTEQSAVAAGKVQLTVTPLSTGGHLYEFRLSGNGSVLRTVVPPAGFDPLLASASELAQYGFPARPKGGSALTDWLRAMADYRSTPVPDLVARAVQNYGPNYDSGWSGWSGSAPSNNSMVAVEAGWDVPTVNTATCGSGATGDWTGLGGANGSGELIQSGVAWDSFGSNAWVPFYEILPYGPASLTKYYQYGNITTAIDHGDAIYNQTGFEAGVGGGTANFYVEDETSGQVFSYSKDNVSPSEYYDGSTFEAIAESPNWRGGGNAPKFSTFEFTDVQGEVSSDGDWKTVGSVSPQEWVAGPSSDRVMYPGALGSDKDSFDSYWSSCS